MKGNGFGSEGHSLTKIEIKSNIVQTSAIDVVQAATVKEGEIADRLYATAKGKISQITIGSSDRIVSAVLQRLTGEVGQEIDAKFPEFETAILSLDFSSFFGDVVPS